MSPSSDRQSGSLPKAIKSYSRLLKPDVWIAILIGLNIAIISLFILPYLNATYPLLGHDYSYFVPRLIDTELHYKINGFSIQWYTPSFGGGLPSYPNPQQIQFSLPQLLTLFINPWQAILASLLVFITLGFIASFHLLKNILGLQPLASILGAAFFSINGFYIEHMAVGHVTFQSFPLVPVVFIALLNPRSPRWLSAILLSMTGAVFVYMGSFYILIILALTALVVFPLMYFLKPALLAWKRILIILVSGGCLAVLLCSSKIYAITAFMHAFPRLVEDNFRVSWMRGMGGMIVQLIGAMSILPFLSLIGKSWLYFTIHLKQWVGAGFGIWEMDSSLSPALSFVLAFGAVALLSRKPKVDKTGLVRKIVAALLLVLAVVIVLQFTLAKGFIYQSIHDLPVIRSSHVNTRFVSAFIFPLSLLGAMITNKWMIKAGWRGVIAFVIIDGVTLASMWSYYLLPIKTQQRYFDVTSSLNTYAGIRQGETYPVRDINASLNDWEVFQAHTSNLRPYEILFGAYDVNFTPALATGSVFAAQDGFYNMTDPTGYVFPTENHSRLYAKIPVADHDKLVAFVNRHQPDWKLPTVQVISDWLALVFLSLESCGVCFYLYRKWVPASRPSPKR